MPFVLIFVGLLLTVAGVRNKQKDLYNLILGDFTGPNNFFYWAVAVIAIGSLGYIEQLKQFATAFLCLLLAVLLLQKDAGFFTKLTQAFSEITTEKAQLDSGPSVTLDIPEGFFGNQKSSSATGASHAGDALNAAWEHRDLVLALMGGM